MAEIHDITDANWQSVIGNQPALILISTGDGVRSDFSTQFKKSAQESDNVLFAQFFGVHVLFHQLVVRFSGGFNEISAMFFG